MTTPLRTLLLALTLGALCLTAQTEEERKWGHSAHGSAFDEGPRQRPWKMNAIGKSSFPITTASAEAQQWFNQGNTLLHSFWYFEAERAFRWALKLDPECAMCYWGMARAAVRESPDRSRELIREAAKRKANVTEREQLYITAWEKRLLPEEPGEDEGSSNREYKRLLERIAFEYPDDLEAKALVALDSMWNNRYGAELILQSILEKEPEHPGAHHYRVHAWDGTEGHYALDSCRVYGRIAGDSGHAQHMPGHVFSGIGMWHEAAIAMDSATRVEKAYMQRRLSFPFNDFNYKHNRNYLSYIQEHLGMAERAIDGARQILSAPLDPKYNEADNFYGSLWQGRVALMRALIKYERWNELLDESNFGWGDTQRERIFRAYLETLAHLGLGDLEEAKAAFRRHEALADEADEEEDGRASKCLAVQYQELPALIRIAQGDEIGGLAALAQAARAEQRMREDLNDPPYYPRTLYNILGRAYLERGSPRLAVHAFKKALEMVPNDGFALSGLVEAYAADDELVEAKDAYARLLHVWSDADPGLKWLERLERLNLAVEPRDGSPGEQRNYAETSLDHLGPSEWAPFAAPELEAVDSKGKSVSLEQYRGKNVLLIFYLGDECVHCMEQLVAINELGTDLIRLDIEVLAISSAAPSSNAKSERLGKLPFRLLSDENYANARRFLSYDEFEEIELHSTIFIDRKGRIRWARNGGDPFMDFDFLVAEVERSDEFLTREDAEPEAAE